MHVILNTSTFPFKQFILHMPSPWHYRAMVEAGTDECNVNKDCPAGKFCDVHTCRACLHERAACHFIGKEILVEDDFTLFPTKEMVFFL